MTVRQFRRLLPLSIRCPSATFRPSATLRPSATATSNFILPLPQSSPSRQSRIPYFSYHRFYTGMVTPPEKDKEGVSLENEKSENVPPPEKDEKDIPPENEKPDDVQVKDKKDLPPEEEKEKEQVPPPEKEAPEEEIVAGDEDPDPTAGAFTKIIRLLLKFPARVLEHLLEIIQQKYDDMAKTTAKGVVSVVGTFLLGVILVNLMRFFQWLLKLINITRGVQPPILPKTKTLEEVLKDIKTEMKDSNKKMLIAVKSEMNAMKRDWKRRGPCRR